MDVTIISKEHQGKVFFIRSYPFLKPGVGAKIASI